MRNGRWGMRSLQRQPAGKSRCSRRCGGRSASGTTRSGTDEADLHWIQRFFGFAKDAGVSVEVVGTAEVRRFLESLAVDRGISASTQNQAFAALLFLFSNVLERPLGDMGDTVRARRPSRLPLVLAKDEVLRLFPAMEGTGNSSTGPACASWNCCGCGSRMWILPGARSSCATARAARIAS